MRDALAVSFDKNTHDYLSDIEKRFDYYHKKENRIPFDLDFFNKVTKIAKQNTKRCSCIL